MTDTPADDALRAAVERVERALSRFEATRIADLDWPTKVSVEPADLRLILSALSAQLEAERATGDETARHISRLLDHLARETARADKAVAEAKALREAVKQVLPWLSSAAVIEFAGPRPAEILRATLAQPAAKETI